jgi:hypothetical protein
MQGLILIVAFKLRLLQKWVRWQYLSLKKPMDEVTMVEEPLALHHRQQEKSFE